MSRIMSIGMTEEEKEKWKDEVFKYRQGDRVRVHNPFHVQYNDKGTIINRKFIDGNKKYEVEIDPKGTHKTKDRYWFGESLIELESKLEHEIRRTEVTNNE